MASITEADGSAGATPTRANVATASGPASSPAEAANPRRCPYARQGLRFYRQRYVHHLAVRQIDALWPPGRKPRNCADADYLAEVWPARAYQQRVLTERYLERRARELEHPKWIALRLLEGNRTEWECLLYISSKENATMDPTLDFGGGHGNVDEAYGIPQAYPGTKMASAGSDWRTNPETQLRWMIGYARERYGSLCGAAYSRRVNGTY